MVRSMDEANSASTSRQGFSVQVVYAPPAPALPVTKVLTIAPGTTIGEAVMQSGIDMGGLALNLQSCKVGIWGKLQEWSFPVPEASRIELYRPLIADPKEARRQRAVGVPGKK